MNFHSIYIHRNVIMLHLGENRKKKISIRIFYNRQLDKFQTNYLALLL